ncbi:MAG: hypothetical protein NXH88_13865 [Hyphomonas sp.]|nr:hypothetical protein [Hyphomonas sp.]
MATHLVVFEIIALQADRLARQRHISVALRAEEPSFSGFPVRTEVFYRKKTANLETVKGLRSRVVDRLQALALPVRDGGIANAIEITQLLARVVPVAARLARVVSTRLARVVSTRHGAT